MRRVGVIVAAACVLLLCGLSSEGQTAPAPVNPHATPEARALLGYIDSISGHSTLSGQHNYPNAGSRWSDRAYDLTGKYPALFGEDFGFSGGDDKDSVEVRPATVAEVKRQYERGAVITLTWHAVRPTDDEPVTFHDSVQGHLTDFEWHELLTPGTDLNKRWCAQADVIAGYLEQLQAAHVPVLFRAYHEMNGNWFWWGGRPGQDGSAALYRQIYDRFVNVHHLNNLVWVWNVNAPSGNAGSIADYYPGPQYVDLLTIDIYGEFKPEYYTNMLALAAGKPIALGEVGAAPTAEILASQPRWTYFMVWSDLVDALNTPASLNAIYHAPNVLTLDSPALAEPMAKIRQETEARTAGKPAAELVSAEAADSAKDLLARLYQTAGQSVLSGQANAPQAVTAATDAVTAAAGKRPAIYAQELSITSEMGVAPAEARRAIVDAAKRQHATHGIVMLTWHPVRPTDDESASEAKSVRGTLTDFEWNELLTPGTDLYKRWCTQVDELAATLKSLQDAGIAVLWEPYPDANGSDFWWAGRKGIHGSAALYRQLFDRLVNHDGVHTLVWVWAAAAPGFRPGGPGAFSDFFPGLLYVDALALDTNRLDERFHGDVMLERFATGKPIGLGLTGSVPAADVLAQQPGWAWFVVSPQAATEQTDALRGLYASPRVVSISQ